MKKYIFITGLCWIENNEYHYRSTEGYYHVFRFENLENFKKLANLYFKKVSPEKQFLYFTYTY